MIQYHRNGEVTMTGGVHSLAAFCDCVMEIWAKNLKPPYEFQELNFRPIEGYPGYYFAGDSYYSEDGKNIYESVVEKRNQFLNQ